VRNLVTAAEILKCAVLNPLLHAAEGLAAKIVVTDGT
jgi:hypothetical protein